MDGVTCHLPEAFLVYKQFSNPNAITRISLNPKLSSPERIYIDDEKATFENIAIDHVSLLNREIYYHCFF